MSVAFFLSDKAYIEFCSIHKRLLEFCESHKTLYLYGNGKYADVLRDYMEHMGICITGNCISGVPDHNEKAISISHMSEDERKRAGFIYAVKEENQEKIDKSLASKGIKLEPLQLPDAFFKTCRDYILLAHGMKRIGEIEKKERKNPLSLYAEIENRVCKENSKRWIILQRQYGMGDAFYLEPIARRLHGMGYGVFISTDYGFVFKNLTYILEAFPFGRVPQWILDRAFLIDFFNAYEKRPFMHILDAYIRQIQEVLPGFSIENDNRIPIYDASLIRDRDRTHIKKVCVNFEASEWKSRMYPRKETELLLKGLAAQGYDIYEIGVNEDYYLGVGENCYGLSFPETMKLMSEMDIFMGVDNGLMHFAQSIHLPVFILFGCTCPLYRIIDWGNARVMWKNANELICSGCHHRVRIPQNYTYCGRDGHYCMDWTAEEVLDAFKTLKYDTPPDISEEDTTPICWEDKEWKNV